MYMKRLVLAALASGALGITGASTAAVGADEAAQLGKTLTPLGAEKAGNKDGTIPPWEGGLTKPATGYKPGGRRDQDPYAGEKPLFSITAKNMDQYADRLTDGSKAMLKKHATYRIDVYPTHRTAAAPQWVYDNSAKNATNGKLSEKQVPTGVFAGIPFPIPKNGAEAMWNHLLNWRAESWELNMRAYLVTSEGKPVMTVDTLGAQAMPYYYKDSNLDASGGNYWSIRLVNTGPAIRAGEAILGRLNLDAEKDISHVYLAGQRRTRKLPNTCCDTPTPATAGVMSFDEVNVFGGRLDRFDWKLLGKKEMFIPYNANKTLAGKDTDLITGSHLNPDAVRWELHRVWVVEANLKPGMRHVAPKSRYYLDEDTWTAVLGDRWDAKGQLWKTVWQLPVMMPDIPATTPITFGFYDLTSNTWFANGVMNEKPSHYRVMPRYPETTFSPDSLSSGVR
jgi:hypothetical protein